MSRRQQGQDIHRRGCRSRRGLDPGQPIDIQTWTIDDAAGFLQGPLDLAFLDGKVLDLHLDAGQVALLSDGSDVAAAFLPGQHVLTVGHEGGDLPSRGSLLFLTTGADIRLRWPDGDCRLRLTSPVAFHAAFLRRSEKVGQEFVLRVLTALVRDRLEAAPRTPEGAGTGELAATAPTRRELERALGPLGLTCLALRLGPARAPATTPASTPASSPEPEPATVAVGGPRGGPASEPVAEPVTAALDNPPGRV